MHAQTNVGPGTAISSVEGVSYSQARGQLALRLRRAGSVTVAHARFLAQRSDLRIDLAVKALRLVD